MCRCVCNRDHCEPLTQSQGNNNREGKPISQGELMIALTMKSEPVAASQTQAPRNTARSRFMLVVCLMGTFLVAGLGARPAEASCTGRSFSNCVKDGLIGNTAAYVACALTCAPATVVPPAELSCQAGCLAAFTIRAGIIAAGCYVTCPCP